MTVRARSRRWRRGRLLLAGGAALLVAVGAPAHAEETRDSCVDCHSDPGFLVTNKKLYDYFQQWEVSIHSQEGVTCDECHGGRPDRAEKEAAHAEGVGASDPLSGIHYTNVADTCGQCHDGILEGFRTSEHFAHIEKKDDKQGPTCVTCHGSINVEVLNVNSVEAACERCHNEDSDNHPEMPARARDVLNRFLSINRFYRYIAIHAQPEEARTFFEAFDRRLDELSATWHTFDVERAEAETAEALGVLKEKRAELRRRRRIPAVPPPRPSGEEAP
jgi:nitrate/TMAO reductase-like tetraheme cytochrome c subunit